MRVSILNLVAIPSSISEEVVRHRTGSCIVREPDGMGDRYCILSSTPKHQKVVSGRNSTSRGIVNYCLMRQPFCHCAVTHCQRLFPHMVSGYVPKPGILVQSNNITREVREMVHSTVARWDVGTVDSSDTPRHCQSMQVPHHETVMLEELFIAPTIREVPF